MTNADYLRSAKRRQAPEDVIAQAIRVADGDHTMGAGALGEVAVRALREAGYVVTREALCARAGGCGG